MTSRQLRRRVRVSYQELEEPPFDEYVYCESCADYVYEHCSIHGPLLVIPDDKASSKWKAQGGVPRAALTVPRIFLHLAFSNIPGAGLGVFSTMTLPRGVRFGPYRGAVTEDASSSYCWQIYDKNNKPSHYLDGGNAQASNWMRYVNCARHWREQNLVAFQYKGLLYYRTIKIIPRFTELLVFYGSEYAISLDIDLKNYNSTIGYIQPTAYLQVLKPKSQTDIGGTTISSNARKRKCEFDTEQIQQKMNPTSLLMYSKDSEISDCTTEKYICDYCSQIFNAKDILIQHIEAHSTNTNASTKGINDNGHECELCGNRYKHKYNMDRHIKERHLNEESRRRKKFECEYCGLKATQSDLKRHKSVHFGGKHECPICLSKYKNFRTMMIHFKSHQNQTIFYPCTTCDAKFSNKEQLYGHYYENTNCAQYKCAVCEQTFTPSSLPNHSCMKPKPNTSLQPHCCQICYKNFTQNYGLKKHMLTHIEAKPEA